MDRQFEIDMSNYLLEQAFAGIEPYVSMVFSLKKLAEIERIPVSGLKLRLPKARGVDNEFFTD